jgi:iron(III) transport system permease protein
VVQGGAIATGGATVTATKQSGPGSFIDDLHPEGFVNTRFFRGSGTSQAAAVVSGAAALLLELGYLVVLPLFRLQSLAFEDGAQGYRDQFGRSDIAQTLQTTVVLALVSLVIAMVLGTVLAFAVSRLPRRVGFLRIIPIMPIVMPSVANVVGWAFLLSPGPGYLNALMRQLPWWDHLDTGPVNVYSSTWIILITGFGLTSFVYLYDSAGMQNIGSEHLEAAAISGSSTIGVFFKVVLPLLRPSLVYGSGVALLLGLGQFTGPLLLGQNEGVNVLTTEMYRRTSESPTNFAAAAAAGADGIIVEVHDDPEAALCDGPHQIHAKDFPAFAAEVAAHAELLGKRLA